MDPPANRPALPPDALARLLDADPRALGGIELGVATSSFQCEGGLDGPGEPETNWRAWVAKGRAEPIGAASALWKRFDLAAQRARAMQLDAFRLSFEWARLCPNGERVEPRAAEGYAERLARLRRAGLEPVVTLQHFTHPAWAGEDLWLDERAPRLFANYAAGAAVAVGEALVRRGERPVARFITINEPNMLALASYLAGVFPHGEKALMEGDPVGVFRALRALDQLTAAHVLAVRAIHAAYEQRAWPRPEVTWNVNFVDVYALCRMPFDLLRAPELGVAPAATASHCARGAERFLFALHRDERSPRVEASRSIHAVLSRLIGPEVFDATMGVLHARRGVRERLCDSIALDVYDPWSYQQFRGGEALFAALARGEPLTALPATLPSGVRLAEPWEWVVDPGTMVRALEAMHSPEAPLPLDVMENGMAQRRDVGASTETRADGVTRPEFVRGYALAFAYARAVLGLPARGYFHWTLVDNYELGRYAPRFGLYALGDGASATWAEVDASGHDAAAALGAFASVVRASREGDPRAVRAALEACFGGVA